MSGRLAARELPELREFAPCGKVKAFGLSELTLFKEINDGQADSR